MISYSGARVICLLSLVTLFSARSIAQTAFETQLASLNKAIVNRESYNQDKRRAELIASFPAQLRTETNLAIVTPSSGDSNRAIGAALTDIVDSLATGTAAVYTGSGLTQLNVQIQQNESTWKSTHIRNGFDKTRPFLDVAGNILVGASLVLTSQKNSPGGAKASGIAGIAALTAGSLLQHFLGSKQSQLDSAAGTVNGISVDIAQLEFSRAAYDDLDLRYKTAKGYYDNARSLLPVLRDLLARCKAVRDNPAGITDDDLRKLVDDVSAARDRFEKTSDFVDVYTKQLADAYTTYEDSYPVLKSQLDPLLTQIKSFRDDYHTNIEQAFLADFPKFAGLLIDLRAKIGT